MASQHLAGGARQYAPLVADPAEVRDRMERSSVATQEGCRRGDNSRGGLPTYRVDKVKHERCGLSQGSIGSPRKDNRASSKDLDPQGFVAVNFPLTSGGTPAIHNPEHTPLEIIHSKRAEINTRSTGLIL